MSIKIIDSRKFIGQLEFGAAMKMVLNSKKTNGETKLDLDISPKIILHYHDDDIEAQSEMNLQEGNAWVLKK
jgi:hypothetical protein